jgi:hypothetical protein
VAVWADEDGIAPHGCCGGCAGVVWVVETCVVVAACYDLKGVTVEMEGMFSRIIIVEDYFDDLVLREYE